MVCTKEELEKQKQERLGEINISNEGYKMKIVEYKNTKDIIVEFQDEYKAKVHTQYGAFKKGNVKNVFHKSVCGVGYIGDGKYKSKINGKLTKAYKYWHKMLLRCYDPYLLNKEPTYINCYVCDEWLNFQNFSEWYEDNYYEIPNEKVQLDKDILVKGNKIYSPETCIFVPQRINSLFIKRDAGRGKYPIGVYWHKENNKFITQCQIIDKENYKERYLGTYNTSEEAFLAYKNFKEKYIKEVADEYKYLIPKELYDAMYKYEVEIND